MVLKLRRYRVFLAFAAIATIALVQFVRMRDWSPSFRVPGPPIKEQPQPEVITEDTAAPPGFITEAKPSPKPKPAPNNDDSNKPSSDSDPSPGGSNSPSRPVKTKPDPSKQDKPSKQNDASKQPDSSSKDGSATGGQGSVDGDTSKSTEIHWERQPEHFPVADEDVIKLPTGQTKEIPKIQYNFSPEVDSLKFARERRRARVKESFENSWKGYKETAWGHDELRPVTGGYRDPFNGWGATLVDSLDTLWIMGMKEEFEDAVKQVQKIDFTTSIRKDIPLFETVIRYLGGLIAAYDITDGHYVVLLDKAVELADILMGAFDTPNRMPMTYYNWAPAYASQPHRAGTRVVVAELASLSLEFTRLAQLTQKDRYYDAIARITNALDKYQMDTNLPGLWPTHVDTSGCKKPEEEEGKIIEHAQGRNGATSKEKQKQKGNSKSGNVKRQQSESTGSGPGSTKNTAGSQSKGPSKAKSNGILEIEDPSQQDCEKQGLSSPPSSTDKFTIGALADSAYEYLPKEYMLLGGLKNQYRKMYERSMDSVRKYLLYRPMGQDNRKILFAASVTSSEEPTTKNDLEYKYEGSHLACFAGGMFGIGAKIFGIKGDLQIASKLTDGCVWAYQSTTTGIMPESFELLPCRSMDDCPWDETAYRKALDPYEETRTEEAVSRLTREDEIEKNNKELAEMAERYRPKSSWNKGNTHAKRRIYKTPDGKYLGRPDTLSHDDYVDARIREERLPYGYTDIISRKYILRPEAIESVFIMYRITGDDYWRERGWEMFQAIEKHTRTPLGSSAINDVTSEAPMYMNKMESFWLGETLKYFYLLFSEPSLVSLDDYVLNTEAHPFKRPE